MSASSPTPAKRKRGRPTAAATWRTLDEVSEILGLPVAMLERLLKRVPGALPGATLDADGWRVPERGLRELLGRRIEQYATVAEVAEALRVSPKTVYEWTTRPLEPLHGQPLLESRMVVGMKLIPVRAVLALPARHPAPSLFFAHHPGPVTACDAGGEG